MVCDRHDIEVVTHNIALHDEVGLHSQHLFEGGHDHAGPGRDVDRHCLQWSGATKVAQPCLHPVEGSHDGEGGARRPHGRRPTLAGLDGLEDLRVALIEVDEHVIVVERLPMSGVQGSSRAADEDGIGHELLEASGGLQYLLETP